MDIYRPAAMASRWRKWGIVRAIRGRKGDASKDRFIATSRLFFSKLHPLFTGQAGRTAAEQFSTDRKHSFPSQPALAGYQLAKISQLVSDKRPDRPAEGTCGPDWSQHPCGKGRRQWPTDQCRDGCTASLARHSRGQWFGSRRARSRAIGCRIAGLSVLLGEARRHEPPGKVRCHIRKQIELAAVATQPNQPHGHDPGGSGAYAIRALPN